MRATAREQSRAFFMEGFDHERANQTGDHRTWGHGADAAWGRGADAVAFLTPAPAVAQITAIKTRQTYATADLGIIAYETDGADGALLPGMLVNDDLTVEIVTPGTDEPAAAGKVGEVVVTRLQGDY